MEMNERVEAINKVLNELVKVTFEREALFGELGRLGLYIEGDTDKQKELKARARELLTEGKEFEPDVEMDIDNWGTVTLYRIIERSEISYTKQQIKRFPNPSNYHLIPYGFVMGRKCTKTVRDNVLRQMK